MREKGGWEMTGRAEEDRRGGRREDRRGGEGHYGHRFPCLCLCSPWHWSGEAVWS